MFGRISQYRDNRITPVDLVLLPEVQALLYEPVEHQLLINLDTGEVRDIGVGDADTVEVPIIMYGIHAEQMGAKRVVLVHNHPPGEDGKVDYRPSEDDCKLTWVVSEYLRGKGIELADHLVVSTEGVYSYKFRRRLHTRSTLPGM